MTDFIILIFAMIGVVFVAAKIVLWFADDYFDSAANNRLDATWMGKGWNVSIPERKPNGIVTNVELARGLIIFETCFGVTEPSPAGKIGDILLKGIDGVTVHRFHIEKRTETLLPGDTVHFDWNLAITNSEEMKK